MTRSRPTAALRPISRITPDPRALKALAHPDRLRILGLLRLEGPATATGLARRMGLNSGATSYHLRQLAEHGFIEAAEDLGNRRDRWWRSRHEATTIDPSEMTGDALEAGLAMTQAVIATHVGQMQAAHAAYGEQPLAWRKASTASDFTIELNAEEAKALVDRILAILWEVKATAPAPGDALPPDVRPFTVLLHAFPYVALDAPEREEPEA